ncbi:hypothetical protein LINPERPRIM_LOCUS20119, partial [Linum perenne]
DRTWRLWIFQSKLLSVKRRIATFLVSESLAVRVSRRVLESRLLVSFSFQVRVVVKVSRRSGVRLSSVELQVGLVKGRLGDYFGVTIILDLCFS